MGLTDPLQKLMAVFIMPFMAMMKTKFHAAEAYGRHKTKNASQVETITTIIVVAAMIIIGILVYGEIESALGDPSNTQLSNAGDNATNTTADAFEFAPVVLIVLVAGLVIGVVRGFAGR